MEDCNSNETFCWIVAIFRQSFCCIVAIRSYTFPIVLPRFKLQAKNNDFKTSFFQWTASHWGIDSYIVCITGIKKVFYNPNCQWIVSPYLLPLPGARLLEILLWDRSEDVHWCIMCQHCSWAKKMEDYLFELAPVLLQRLSFFSS